MGSAVPVVAPVPMGQPCQLYPRQPVGSFPCPCGSLLGRCGQLCHPSHEKPLAGFSDVLTGQRSAVPVVPPVPMGQPLGSARQRSGSFPDVVPMGQPSARGVVVGRWVVSFSFCLLVGSGSAATPLDA